MIQLLKKLRKYRIFASYSHDDKKIVDPLISFLTPCYDVFYDKNSIGFGMKWQVVIEKSINECHGLFIFWCMHSAQSTYVKIEYEQALMLNKHIYPVLLDKTPLPEELEVYQAVDFTDVVGNHNNTLIRYQDKTTPNRKDETEKHPLTEPSLKLGALSVAKKILHTNIVNEINKIVQEEFQTVIHNPKENFGSLVNKYVDLENRNVVFGDIINPIVSHTKNKIMDEINFKFNVTDFNIEAGNAINPNKFISGGKLDFS